MIISENANRPKPSVWQICISVVGALIGVQSSKVRERDFENGRSWWVYVLVACVLVVFLVVGLVVFSKTLVGEA